jgi:hypothetical protein
MSKFLSPTQLTKINKWLSDIQTLPVLLHPLHPVIPEIYRETPPNIRALEVPTYDFKRSNEKRNYGKWKSEYLAKSSREKLRPDKHVVESYCERLGLAEAFLPSLNTVLSMGSLSHPETNELVRSN